MKLYITLGLFTSQMLTREGRHGLRKYLQSSMQDIHDPIMIARYVMAPVNHILNAQIATLKATSAIAGDTATALKLYWLVRQILFKRMMEILSKKGWQPTCAYKDKKEEDCMKWLVTKDSNCGAKHEQGIRGVVQLAFQAYACSMAKKPLFAIIRDADTRRTNGFGVFKEDDDRLKFIADDYGLGRRNDLTDYIERILEGQNVIGHPHALKMHSISKRKPPSTKRKTPPTSNKGGKAKAPKLAAEDDPDDQVEGTGNLRRSGRAATPKSAYAETSNEEEEELDNRPVPEKKPKKCPGCDGLTECMKILQKKSVRLTDRAIINKAQDLLRMYIPALSDLRLRPEAHGEADHDKSEDDNSDDDAMAVEEKADDDDDKGDKAVEEDQNDVVESETDSNPGDSTPGNGDPGDGGPADEDNKCNNSSTDDNPADYRGNNDSDSDSGPSAKDEE
jgi:hypothetical protein